AAGLTSSSFEMAARGGVGLELHLDKVPLRDSSLLPEDILLSESQERMLMIVEPGNYQKVRDIFTRWELDAEIIGSVTAGPDIELFWQGKNICRINPTLIVDQAPRYERAYEKWSGIRNQSEKVSVSYDDRQAFLLRILSNVRGTSRNWI